MSSRTRVAVVVDRVHDYQVPVIRGVESVLHAAGAALVVVVSHPLHSRQDTMLRLLVRAGLLHGVVITAMRDASTHHHRVARAVEFAEGIPVVTIGVEVPGFPVVLSENAGGVRLALAHLLDECGRTRPVLLAGTSDNDDSTEREAAFRAMAAERQLDLPRQPVTYASFERDHAYRRVIEMIKAGRDFDSVLAANDDMAMGALDALNERWIRVPDDVAVVGFDNIAEAYRTDPPLTSVDIELDEQGRTAARMVLEQLAGRSVPDQVRPAAQLVVRRSSRSGAEPADPAGGALDLADDPDLPPAERVLAAVAAIAQGLNLDFQERLRTLAEQWIPGIVDGTMTAERAGTLGPDLVGLVNAYPEPTWWQGLTATLQSALAASAPDGQVTPAAEIRLLRMVLHVDLTLTAVREQRDREQLALFEHVLELNRALSGCDSLADLTREVGAYLPRLNIRRCFIVLLDHHVDRQPHDDPSNPPSETGPTDSPGLGRLVMSYRDGSFVADLDQTRFSIDRLLPPSLYEELEQGTLTVQPLFSAERWFGIVLHDQNPIDRYTGEALRLDASRVLDAIARAEELTERASELEALVATRTEQLELEVSGRRAAQENLHQANLSLRRALLRDGLTGLQNRPSFDEHLGRAWAAHLRSQEPLSVLMVDVDHFKLYNDTYGHLAGDTCLRQVALRLKSAVPRQQDVIARFGGEEFAVLLPGTDNQGAVLVAERLLRELRAAAIPHTSSKHPSRRVSVSIGIGTTAMPGVNSVEALLEFADQAMYAAKHNGRDQVISFKTPVDR